MKRFIFLLIALMCISLPRIFSQEIGYDISVRLNKNQPAPTADVTVTINQGTPAFTIYLMTNDPINGDILQESGTVNKKNYTFKSVQPGKYFVKITDSRGMAAGKTVDIIIPESN